MVEVGGWGLRDCGAGLNTSGQGTVIELHSSLGCEDEGAVMLSRDGQSLSLTFSFFVHSLDALSE